jgi:ABC-type multidrug transport system permease subunit
VASGEAYSFQTNNNYLMFGFISIIIFIFMGLANSLDEIHSEKRSITREMKLRISSLNQLIAKSSIMMLMSIVQVILYYLFSSLMLGFRGFFLPHAVFLLLSAMIGSSIGLFFSTIIKDRKAMINVLPLVIIPQILFSGAVVKFADMNSILKLNPKSNIPEFCSLIPARWLFEGWVTASSEWNKQDLVKNKYYQVQRDETRSYDEFTKSVDDYKKYINSHPDSRYKNRQLVETVNIQTGEFLRTGRNVFLSTKMHTHKKQVSTPTFDIIIALFLLMTYGLASWLTLFFKFR